MTDSIKLASIRTIVFDANSNTLWTAKGRKGLAKSISESIGMFENRVHSFVNEMTGLDLGSEEDRQIFMQFVERGL